MCIAVTVQLSNQQGKAQKMWIEKVQERIRSTSHLLENMKAVKMLNLSGVMAKIIQDLRIEEIRTSKWFRQLLIYNALLCKCFYSDDYSGYHPCYCCFCSF